MWVCGYRGILGLPSTLSEEQKQGVRGELATGTGVSAIARKYATSRQTIMGVLDETQRPIHSGNGAT
ncbi:hypothetical protein RLEG12_07505 (plasmid) [Rhizobium leguminosarum bv. trifolii CB782]|nr:hypothetical protein RLEG12_07505 [Rhizobium leguminosarum bv. trifolii CB782]PON06580.1 hypothetical protein ATY29_15790 [Rhizobium hidalgonense]